MSAIALLLKRNPFKCLKHHLIYRKEPTSRHISTTQLQCKWRRRNYSDDVEEILLQKDKLPGGYQLIYRAPLENYVIWTKNMSTVTVTIIGAISGYQLATQLNYLALSQKMDLGNLVSHEDDLWYFLAGFMLINLAIRLFVAKYPLRIYKQGDKYCAVFGSQLPFGTSQHHFQRGHVREYRNVLNPWSHIMYRLGNRSSMLLIDYFKTPSEFHQLFYTK